MLGRLLEISICARPTPETIDVYGSLGMHSVPVGDIVPGAYAVVSDGSMAIGLHDAEMEGLVPTFVRPDLKEHLRALQHRGVQPELIELADQQFHRAAFRDPSGLMVMLIEARTFAPAEVRPQALPICGEFVELAAATDALEESVDFWTGLGFTPIAGSDTPHPSTRLRGYGLTIGLHESGRFRAALCFRAANLQGRAAYLRAKGFKLRDGSPLTARQAESVTLSAPGNLDLFLLDADAARFTGTD